MRLDLQMCEHRKPAQRKMVACSICGKDVARYTAATRRPICSNQCRFRLLHGRDIATGREVVGPVARTQPSVETKAAPIKVRFMSTSCKWCGCWFTQDMRVTGMVMRYCSKSCAKSSGRARERRSHGQFSIARSLRQKIYERDQWTCQLCGDPVDRNLPTSHVWAATLDHIECQSWALIPDHSATNLRLAHRICNSVRGDRVAA